MTNGGYRLSGIYTQQCAEREEVFLTACFYKIKAVKLSWLLN